MKRTLIAAVGIAVCAIAGVVLASPAMAQEPGANDATFTEIDLSGFENLDSYLNAVATAPDDAPSPLPPAAPIEPVVDTVETAPSAGVERSAVTLPAAGHRAESGVGLLALSASAMLLAGSAAVVSGVGVRRERR